MIMGWGSLCIVLPSISAPNFDSVTPYMGILFPTLRRDKLSTLWSSFLSFMCFAINPVLKKISYIKLKRPKSASSPVCTVQ
jgi:hypothetical protein